MTKQKLMKMLCKTLFVPKLSFNLLSKGIEHGKKFVFTDHSCKILNEKGKMITTATKFRNLYYLNFDEKRVSAHATATCSNNETRKEI